MIKLFRDNALKSELRDLSQTKGNIFFLLNRKIKQLFFMLKVLIFSIFKA